MGFWNQTTLEPKRSHRWLVYFSNANIPSYVAKKVDKPSFEINQSEHKYFGHTFKYPGQVTWNDVTVSLVDPINPDASDALMNVLKRAGYDSPDVRTNDALYTVSKADAVAALGQTIKIEQYGSGDPDTPVETWKLWNPWIKDVKFGELSYDDDGNVEIQLTIAYDWAEYQG